MKIGFFLSFTLHSGIIMGLIVFNQISSPFLQQPKLFRVQLVSSPAKKIETTKKMDGTTKNIDKPKLQMNHNIKKEPYQKVLKKKETGQEKQNTPAASISNGKDVRLDVKNFPFAYYIQLLQNRIQQNWITPYQTSEKNSNSTIISFQILRNGEIKNISIDKPSGKFLWDRSAQRAIYSLNLLPPLPEDYQGEYLNVHVEFEIQ